MELTSAMEAKKKGKLVFHDEALKYARFTAEFRGFARGTVIAGSRMVPAYPHIKRIFTLRKGIERNIKSDTVYIEEKIDGYNIRIAYINNTPVAFSRGGFVEYFVTEKLGDGIRKFLSKHQDAVLCAEVIGNTPYTRPTDKFDVKILVFDIGRGDGGYLGCDERRRVLDKYEIESVPLLGRFEKTDIERIRQTALSMLKSKKEGIVIKSADRKEAVKYVTPFADIEDIANNSRLLFDMPLGFYMQRVLRSAMFIKDFGFDHAEYARGLGNAFYERLMQTLQQIESGEDADEEFEILIKNRKTWDMLMKQMSREVKIEKIFEREENDRTRIRFRKIYRKTTRRLRELLNGKGIED